LFQFGGIYTGRYKAGAKPETTHIFGWPMNNYWVTNFNAEQHGGFTWSYAFTTSPKPDATQAVRFGWENRVPFLSRILPGGGKGDNQWEGSFINGWPENILLVSAMPESEGKSIRLHVRETTGKEAAFNLTGTDKQPRKISVINAAGEIIPNIKPVLKAYESRFLRIDL
jgi:hypothetical protein